MSTKYIFPSQTDEEVKAEKAYIEDEEFYRDLYLLNPKRQSLISKTSGIVLEIASGWLQTLPHYAPSNTTKGVETIIFTEPMNLAFNTGLKKVVNMIDNQSDRYTGSYEKLTNIKDASGKEVNAWKFIFTETHGDLEQIEAVPINVPCFFLQTPLEGVGDLVRQVIPSDTKVDTVVSSFGVCYVCCSIHPLDYIHSLQTIFGPSKVDNTYRLCMLEHGITTHPEVNPPENKWVIQDGGVNFRPLFGLVADARLIIHDLEHHRETKDPDNPTFHIYEAEPNDQSEWVKAQSKKTE